MNSLDIIVYTLGIMLIVYLGYVVARGMIFIVLGITLSVYLGYIVLNQIIYFLAIAIHWWEDRKA